MGRTHESFLLRMTPPAARQYCFVRLGQLGYKVILDMAGKVSMQKGNMWNLTGERLITLEFVPRDEGTEVRTEVPNLTHDPFGFGSRQLDAIRAILGAPPAGVAPPAASRFVAPPPVRPASPAPTPAPAQPAVSAPAPPPVRSIVFVSYRREDSADIVGRICDRLVERLGSHRVFKDVDSVPLGVDYREHIDRAMRRCAIVVAVIGRSWAGPRDSTGRSRIEDPSDLVRLELEWAHTAKVPVIPVLVQHATLPPSSELPEALGWLPYVNGIEVRTDPDFANDVQRLIVGIHDLIGISQRND